MTSCFESLNRAWGIPFRRPSLPLSSRATPSALHKSGRLLSLTSIFIWSPSLASSSHLAKCSRCSSSLAESFFPSNWFRSFRLASMMGMLLLLHRGRVPQPLQVVAEQVPNVVDAHLEHGQPIHAHAPQDQGLLDAEACRYLGPGEPAAGELHPAEFGVLAAELHAGLREGKVIRRELDFGGARYFPGEVAEDAELVAEVDAFPEDEPIQLVEFDEVLGVQHVRAVDAVQREMLAWLDVFHPLPGIVRRAVRGRHDFPRDFLAPGMPPALGTGFPPAFMRHADGFPAFLVRQSSVRWALQLVGVRPRPRGVVLGLEQHVEVVELLGDQRRRHFLEAIRGQPSLDLVDELNIGLPLAGVNAWHGRVDDELALPAREFRQSEGLPSPLGDGGHARNVFLAFYQAAPPEFFEGFAAGRH